MKIDSIKRWTISLVGMAFLFTACGPREIPDQKMAAIIHDVLILNAYYNLYERGGINSDSVDIYAPILEQHGYDVDDFRYSLDRLAMKKSSRLSELIDEATADISRENDFYVARQKIRDRVDSLISDRYRDTVYRMDTMTLRARNLKDTEKLKIRIPASEGKYRITYTYRIDSTDLNHYHVMRYYVKDSADNDLASNSRSLAKGKRGELDISLDVTAKGRTLEVLLADYEKASRAISFSADSLYVSYDEPISISRERYVPDSFERITGSPLAPKLDYRDYVPKDSSTLYAVPPFRADTARHTHL